MVDEDVPCEDVLAQITLPAEQKKADIGIAMGGVGSDIALDAADIALVDDEVKELPHLIALSRRMMITIKCNMSFSMGLNFVAIVLAIIGILNPVVGAEKWISRKWFLFSEICFFVKKQQKQNICLYFGTLYGIVK